MLRAASLAKKPANAVQQQQQQQILQLGMLAPNDDEDV